MPFSHMTPSGRTGHVVVSYKDYVVVWGGYKEHMDIRINTYYPGSEVWLYCPLTETWDLTTCSTSGGPPGMSGSTAVVIDNFLYLFGGYSHELEGSTNNLYRLCLDTYCWEKLQPSGSKPFAVDKMVAWNYSDKLYTFGGFGSPTSLNSLNTGFQFVFDQIFWVGVHNISRGWTNQFYEYDPEANTWRIPPLRGDLPSPRAAHTAAVAGNKVFVFGGRHNRTRLQDLHCLDMETMQWSGALPERGPVPLGRSWHSFTAISSNFLMLYGGFSQYNVALSDCWLLNTNTLTWQPVLLPFQKPRLWHAACLTIFNEVFIFGGCASNILDPERPPEQASDFIVIRMSPKSLYRLCLDKVGTLPQLCAQWETLPHSVQAILNLRHCNAKATSVDGS